MRLHCESVFSGKLPQFLAVFTATLSCITGGMHYAWTAPVLPILEATNSTITITQTDVIWLENLYMIGGFAGMPITILSADKLGRKKLILIGCIQDAIAWIIIAFASSVEYLYVARFFSGIAATVAFVGAPMYSSEIADKTIRGFLGSCVYVMMLIGVLIVYSVAPFVSITVSSAVGCSFLVLQLLTFPFMPESPYYLLLKDHDDAARKSLQMLRATKDVEEELDEIRVAIERQKRERGRPIDLILVKSNRKALLIISVLNFTLPFSGFVVIVMNVHAILGDAGSKLTPSTAAIICSALMLVAVFLSAGLIDKVGRRILLLSSSFLTGVCLLVLASYFAVKNSGVDTTQYNWIPVVSAMLYVITFRYGLGLVPTVMTAELFPTSVKAVGMTSAEAVYVAFSIASVYLFQTLKNNYGMHLPFFIFATCCFITATFTYFVIPETKGRTLEEIQQILKGNSDGKNNNIEDHGETKSSKTEDTVL